jgi:tetratricopeptide (TPR) repeat protein
MKTSVKKPNHWLTLFLVLMILALIGFSLLPIFTNSLTQSSSNNATASVDNTSKELLSQVKGYELVLQREPDNQTALRGLLEAKLKLTDIAGVIAPLEKLAQLNPQKIDYQILIAQAKQQINDYEGSSQTYRQILANSPGEMKALKGLINLYLLQKRPEAAIGILEDSIKIAQETNSPNDQVIDITSIKLLLGEVYLSEQRNQEAIAIYDQAIKENNQDFRPVLAKGLILEKTGEKEAAKAMFKLALELAPPEYKDQIKQLTINN